MMNDKRAVKTLLDMLSIEGQSGREKAVALKVKQRLIEAGCKAAWMRFDQAHEKIPGDFECGNFIVKIPGTVKAPRIMFSGHMDTVPLCKGAQPTLRGNRIISKTKTGLGGDNRVAVAALVILAETLIKSNVPRPPITLLFTVGEEVGLWGARFAKPADLGNPALGFNIDSSTPSDLVVGAIGAHRWEIEVLGISAHAGVHPDHGVSSALIAAEAIADIKKQGYFGRIRKNGKKGTANIGVLKGGEATNQVTDHVYIKGESRSHDPIFLEEITNAYKKTFERIAKRNKNHKKKPGKIKFSVDKDYDAFKLAASDPVIKVAKKAVTAIGLKPKLKVVDGGLDANYLNAKGIPTVTLGAGQHNIHTIDEYVDVKEFLQGCRIALNIASAAGQ